MIIWLTEGLEPFTTSSPATSIIDHFEKLISAKFQPLTTQDRLGYYWNIAIQLIWSVLRYAQLLDVAIAGNLIRKMENRMRVG